MGDGFKEKIEEYNDLYPKGKFPSGKTARSAIGNLEPAFRWFFETFDYSWELIIKATNSYLDEREADNWNYSINSQYFIRKQNTDKTWKSPLADFCMYIESGGADEDKHQFKEKVY